MHACVVMCKVFFLSTAISRVIHKDTQVDTYSTYVSNFRRLQIRSSASDVFRIWGLEAWSVFRSRPVRLYVRVWGLVSGGLELSRDMSPTLPPRTYVLVRSDCWSEYKNLMWNV